MATVVSTPIIRSRQGDDLQQGLQNLLAGLQQFSQARKRKKDFEVLSNIAHQLSGRRGAVGQPGGGPQQPQPPSTQQGLDLVLSNLARLQTNQGVIKALSMADVLNQRANREASLREAVLRRAGRKSSPSVGTDAERMAQGQGFASYADAPPKVKARINKQIIDDSKDSTSSSDAAARETTFVPNKDGTFTQGFTDEISGVFTPFLKDGKPIKLTEKQVLLSQGKKAASLIDPFKFAFDKKAGQQAGELKGDLEQQIVKATQSNRTIERGKRLLDKGIFTGPLANVKTEFNKFLKEFGVNLIGETVATTEAFAAVMARDVLNILGSGDLGAGTGISDNDRLFAAKIVGGAVTLDEGTIRQLLNINKRVNDAKIIMANRRLDRLKEQRNTSDPFTDTPVADRSISTGITAEEAKEQLLKLKGQ